MTIRPHRITVGSQEGRERLWHSATQQDHIRPADLRR